MDLTQLANLGEFIGGVAVLVTLVYLALQVRENTKAVSAATFQAVSSTSSDLMIRVAKNSELNALFEKAVLEPNSLTQGEKIRFGLYMRGVFRNFENYQYQVEKGLLDRGVYEGYFNTMKDILRSPFVRDWWAVQRESYGPAFRTLVDRLLDVIPDSGSVWESVANISLGSPRS